jgi:lipopolysaccharide export system permease protein
LICVLSLSLIVWIIQAVNFLDFVTEDGHGLEVYFKYTLLNIPKIISRLMPFMFFIAIYYSINKSEETNELKIFWINGIDKKEFLSTLLKYSMTFLFIQIFLNSFIVPLSQNKARTYIQSSSIDFFPSLINEKKFIDTVEKLTIYIEKKNEDNEYVNIFIKDEKNLTSTRIIYASKGNLINNQDQRVLKLSNGKIINIDNKNITAFDFKTTIFDLSKYLTKSIVDFKIQEKSSFMLIDCYINFHFLKKKNYYHIHNCNEESLNILQQELFKRIIKPLYYISLAICSGFLILLSKENLNYRTNKSYIFLFGTFILILSELTTSLSGKDLLYFKLSLTTPFIMILSQYIYFKTKLKFN